MSIEITHVRFDGYQKTHEAIVRYKWRSLQDGSIGENDKPTLVTWVDKDGVAYVGSGAAQVRVGAVHPSNARPYLRTYADNQWTNNLVALPTF